MVSTYQKNPRFFPPGSAVFPRVLSRGQLEKLWKTLARMENRLMLSSPTRLWRRKLLGF